MKNKYFLKKLCYLLIMCLVITPYLTFSQIKEIRGSASLIHNLKFKGDTLIIQNNENFVQNNNPKLPPQAGYTIDLPKNILDYGVHSFYEGIYIWKLVIKVPLASSLNIYLHNVALTTREDLYIYGNQNSAPQILNHLNKGTICSKSFIGDKLVLELNSHTEIEKIPFSFDEIGVIIHDINRIGFGDAGSCEVHINCVEGEFWQRQKKGVARVLVKQGNTTFWCTGSLINNTRNDGEPLFLTANHCGENADSTDYSEWSFDFNYEAPGCGTPGIEPTFSAITGAVLLARSSSSTYNGSDFKLLRLNRQVPASFEPYYNGWDRSTTPSQSGVTIHHPQGDVKMISTYNDPLVSTRYDNISEDPDGKYWKVVWNETQNGHGVTEGGSSGSPIFNQSGNIVGALTGGRASCANLTQPDYYGKLSYSWGDSGSDSTNSLSYWLDPTNSSVLSLEGTNLDSTSVIAGFSGNPRNIIVGQSVNYINTSYGNVTSFRWYFEGGSPNYSESKEPGEITYNRAGNFRVQLIATSSNNADTTTINNYIKVLPRLSPNPTSGEVKIAFGNTIPSEYTMRVFNILGQEINYKLIEKGENYLRLVMEPFMSGVHIIAFSSEQINITHKVIVTKE